MRGGIAMKKPKKPAGKSARKPPKAGKTTGRAGKAARPAQKPKPAKAKAKKRAIAPKARPQIRFSDRALIKRAVQPPFPHSEGDYAEPDIVIPGGDEPPGVERELTCPGSVVIYSSWADWVPNCNGLGAGGGNNAVVAKALANAQKAAAKITCPGTCTKRVNEIWRGWDCGPEGAKFLLIGAVELAVVCQIEL
jgi:hypothetical protein